MGILSFKNYSEIVQTFQVSESVLNSIDEDTLDAKTDMLLDLLGESVDGVIESESSTVFDYIFESHKLLLEGKYKQPWAKEIKDKNPTEQYYIVREYAMKAKKEFNRMAKLVSSKSGKGVKFLVDMKSHDSWVDKTYLRKKSASTADDVLRGAILAKTPDQVDMIISLLNKKFNVIDHDFKKQGDDKEFGYFGSHHMSIVMGNGVAVELQVMTKRLWTAKTVAHDVYNDYRTSTNVDPKQKERDLNYSKDLFKWGNGKTTSV